MDLFRYNNPNTFSGGEAIEEYDSVSWVERYRDPGDFEIIARLSSGLREFLPLGTLISHHKTLEVMVVENHQISEEVDQDPTLTITGRSLQTVLESRVVGQNFNWPAAPPASLTVSQYNLVADYPWNQGVKLINDHIQTGVVVNAGDAIPALVAAHDMTGIGVSEARTIKRGNVMQRLMEILEIGDLGIRVIRSHNFALPNPGANTTLLIHDGVDKRSQVIFSTRNGDIDSADYLWSIKKLKNSALVTGRYVEYMAYGPETGMDRRVMVVDGDDIDGGYDVIPTGATLTSVRAAMAARANQALTAQKRLQLSRTDISRTPTYAYRRDYNIGDIVSVDSSYGPVSTMRVVEYVEIVDETGESSHPTLEIL
jgi:Siphovirus ReqiPepy6 Gp37-like protein